MERELEFLLVSAPFRVPLALALIKPLRSRVYSTRKWRERERERERREDRKAEEDFIFGSPMTFASSRERRGTASRRRRREDEDDDVKEEEGEELEKGRRWWRRKRASPNTI